MKYETKNDAVHAFVREFDAIRQDMIAKLIEADPDSWCEETMPTIGDRVYVYDSGIHNEEGTITNIVEDGYIIKHDDGTVVFRGVDGFEVIRDDYLPMWGTMWSFSDPCDIHWIEEENGVELMSRLGFRIYRHEEWGYYFGIDGAGFDFYEAYWFPLYDVRGLHWHEDA